MSIISPKAQVVLVYFRSLQLGPVTDAIPKVGELNHRLDIHLWYTKMTMEIAPFSIGKYIFKWCTKSIANVSLPDCM